MLLSVQLITPCLAQPACTHVSLPRPPRHPTGRCARIKTDFALGVGEVAAALLRVCKYALSALDVHDLIFGGCPAQTLVSCRPVSSAGQLAGALHISQLSTPCWLLFLPSSLCCACMHSPPPNVPAGIYSLAQHHAETRAEDAIRGTPVQHPAMLRWLLYCCQLGMAAYCPTKETFAAAVSCKVSGGSGWGWTACA